MGLLQLVVAHVLWGRLQRDDIRLQLLENSEVGLLRTHRTRAQARFRSVTRRTRMLKSKRLLLNVVALIAIATGTVQLRAQSTANMVCCGNVCSYTSCGCFLFFCWGEGSCRTCPPLILK